MDRTVHVGIAVALFTTAAGFFGGIRGTAADTASISTHARPVASTVASARSYADARARRYGPNAGMYDGVFEKMAEDHADLNAPVNQTDEDRAATLAKRASRRAFDGAPPTIPHRIGQQGPLDCVACHGTGLKIGALVAPKMSHQQFSSCTQCHATKDDPRPGAPAVAKPDNEFAGLKAWGRGSRAWDGAPPTIPHPTAMRGDCTSCHGWFGGQGLKTPHPWRQSCTQCHVPDAMNDQHPAAGLSAVSLESGQNLGPGGALP
ncbi:MAG: diheme cytochrome c precursor [Deltaproteobacteria bacterium]|nr:diheme cytochrome c precursor [Deltaproteobacteria bacterium]